jgi:hypothetical protein
MSASRDGRCIGILLTGFMLSACASKSRVPPSIEFTTVPEAGVGGAARIEPIAGCVKGATPGQRIVLFAKSGLWWVQPTSARPFTAVEANGTWKSTTHMGTEYAALLVEPGFTPPRTTDVLPTRGGTVAAVATAVGRPSPKSSPLVPRRIHFSGYEWEVTQIPTDSGGVMHENRASNVWTDDKGWLHLRIAREGSQWTCADIGLTRSLGYGSYGFAIHEMPALEPSTVLGMYTWDPAEGGQNHREMDVELSQWGDPAIKNTQFVIQPYYVAANVFRFNSPPGPQIHSFQWDPGRVTFRSTLGTNGKQGRILSEHVFTSGIPSPGGETVHINLYTYGKSRTPQERGVEVVFENFKYLP